MKLVAIRAKQINVVPRRNEEKTRHSVALEFIVPAFFGPAAVFMIEL